MSASRAQYGAALAPDGPVPGEKPSLPPESDRRTSDRRATDTNLLKERHTADRMLDEDGEARVVEIVRDRRSDTERRLGRLRKA
jgi:hypothetical protein